MGTKEQAAFEDILRRLEEVPNDVRRSLEVVRDLDRRWKAKMQDLKDMQEAYVLRVKAAVVSLPKDGSVDLRAATTDAAALEDIRRARAEAQAMAEEKLTLTQQALNVLDGHIATITSDVNGFVTVLKATGQLPPHYQYDGGEDEDEGEELGYDGVYGGGGGELGFAYTSGGGGPRPGGGGGGGGAWVAQKRPPPVPGGGGGPTMARQASVAAIGVGTGVFGLGEEGGGGRVGAIPLSAGVLRTGSTSHLPNPSPPFAGVAPPPAFTFSRDMSTMGGESGSGRNTPPHAAGGGHTPFPLPAATMPAGQSSMFPAPGPGGGIAASAASSATAAASRGAGGGIAMPMSTGGAMHSMGGTGGYGAGRPGATGAQGGMGRGGGGGGGGGVRDKGRKSGEVEEEEEERYCICHQPSFGEMIGCDNDDCPHKWFHYECVGLKTVPEGTWYCPTCRATAASRAANAFSAPSATAAASMTTATKGNKGRKSMGGGR